MEPNDAASGSARATELRASLSARRDIESLLAEASATREAAVADADAIIEEAQQVSEQLVRESRSEADRVTTDARTRAEGVVARARSEAEEITRQARAAADAVRARAEAQVEEYRRRVRAELTEQVTREVTEQSRRELARVQERQQGMIGDIEASVRILGVSMEAAVANIGEMLGALDSLRVHTTESLGEAGTTAFTEPPRHADAGTPASPGGRTSVPPEPVEPPRPPRPEPIDHLIRSTLPGEDAGAEAEDGPAGSWVDGLAPDSAVPSAEPVYDAAGEEPTGTGDEPPRTATEAFLLSAHVDHGDPPLPPMDDSDIGARYARDAMRATARSKTRRAGDRPEGDHAAGSAGADGRPDGAVDRASDGTADGTVGGSTSGSTGGPAGAAADRTPEAEDAETSGKPLGWLFRSS